MGRLRVRRDKAPEIPPALHADLELVAEPRRDLLRHAHRQSNPSRHVQVRTRPGRREHTYLAANYNNPEPFIWTATAEQILAKVRRGRVTLDAMTDKPETHD